MHPGPTSGRRRPATSRGDEHRRTSRPRRVLSQRAPRVWHTSSRRCRSWSVRQPGVEVDVRPVQGQRLAKAQPGGEHGPDQSLQSVAPDRFEQRLCRARRSGGRVLALDAGQLTAAAGLRRRSPSRTAMSSARTGRAAPQRPCVRWRPLSRGVSGVDHRTENARNSPMHRNPGMLSPNTGSRGVTVDGTVVGGPARSRASSAAWELWSVVGWPLAPPLQQSRTLSRPLVSWRSVDHRASPALRSDTPGPQQILHTNRG